MQDKYRKYLEDMQEKDTHDLEMPKLVRKDHQQEPQELSNEKPQHDKPAGSDLAAGGGAQARVQEKAWLPAEPNKTGFAGQGRSVQ